MTSSATMLHTEPTKPEKKNFLSRLFSRKRKQKETETSVQQKAGQTDNAHNIRKFGDEMYEVLERQNRLFESLADSHNIRKFGDEMYEILEKQNRLFESLADSLEHKNHILNGTSPD